MSHGNIMSSICQSRLSEVHSEQSCRNGKPLSKIMASGLVASYSVQVLGFTNNVHIPVTHYASASGVKYAAAILLFPLLHALQGQHES